MRTLSLLTCIGLALTGCQSSYTQFSDTIPSYKSRIITICQSANIIGEFRRYTDGPCIVSQGLYFDLADKHGDKIKWKDAYQDFERKQVRASGTLYFVEYYDKKGGDRWSWGQGPINHLFFIAETTAVFPE